MVTRKQELEIVDGTPEKRLFLSIISDYDLKTGLCELVDNALDVWISNGKKPTLEIKILLDVQRQMIIVSDTAGGVREDQLRLLIAPGASRNNTSQELIGIFGVGGKRAGVALGEHVEISTRYKKEKSLQIDITNEWLSTDDWHLAVYEIPDLVPNTTTVTISKLRKAIEALDVGDIREHLAETYSWFLNQGSVIKLNEIEIQPIEFENWAYSPNYEPKKTHFSINPDEKRDISVVVTGGLITDRTPEAENYGVYIYCNHRLIVKELRTREVGYFVSSEAGVPHPDASLCRVIVRMQGPPDLMPWNSSKSAINYTHLSFALIRPTLIGLVSYFSSLSRRTKNDWAGQVFSYNEGNITDIEPTEVTSGGKLVLPKLPRVRRLSRSQELREKNKKILADSPWTIGIVEAMGIVDLIFHQKLETKNRIALILLDSNFEISLKEFIVNRKDLFPMPAYNDAKISQIFSSRHNVINEVTRRIPIDATLLGKVNYYYSLRNKLIHERATVGITDGQVDDYRKTIEKVLKLLFGLNFPAI